MDGENMEVRRTEVPLYGHEEVHLRLHIKVPAHAEFYVVARGSRLSHVAPAKRDDDGLSLCFSVPGHDLEEVVTVTAFLCVDDQVKSCDGGVSLDYCRDGAQQGAEYLRVNLEQLGPHTCHEMMKRFPSLVDDDKHLDTNNEHVQRNGVGRRTLDEKITHALENLDFLQKWKNSDDQHGEAADVHPKETLLHIAVRLGLIHLVRFLVQQPRGQVMLTASNQVGDTPLGLAQKEGRDSMIEALTGPSGPGVGPAPGSWCVWSDDSYMLRFTPRSDCLSLTVRETSTRCPEEFIKMFREKLRDQKVLKQIRELKGEQRDRNEVHRTDEGVRKQLHVKETELTDNVFEERCVLSLDGDTEEEERPSSTSVNGHSMKPVGVQLIQRPTVLERTMNHSRDQIVTQPTHDEVDDVTKLTVRGVTRDSSGTDGLWDGVETEDVLLVTDTPPPCSGPLGSSSSPPLSPLDQALIRLSRPSSSEPTNHRESPLMDTDDLSPSLVALELDSEDDNAEPTPLLSPFSPLLEKDEEKCKTFPASSDLSCTRSQSTSTCEHASQELGDTGIRLRSYSYSSSKISLRPRFSRDVHVTDPSSPDVVLNSVSHSRSLLQALSLSKSLSLLHPGKQRVPSVSDHLQEKRIEEEELDKYSIPSKAESEKYKVIRTFSFLKNRMSSTRNKVKGKSKERDSKEREQNRHRFSSGPCLGPTVCLVCDKPASGKDFLHCSGCTAMVHKGCKDSLPPCLKKPQDKYSITTVKSRTASLPQNFTVRESAPQLTVPISSSLPVMTPKVRREVTTPVVSLPGCLPSFDSEPSERSEMESDAQKPSSQSEELLLTPASPADSSFGEDCSDSYLHSLFSVDSTAFDAESWSLTVEHKFCKKQDKQVIKRQDVIYELMQTELHHLQTLHIMAEVFRRGMKEEVQLDTDAVERVFPCLDQLLHFHRAFFSALKERRHASAQPPGTKNYLIQRIGDVLLQQFSEDNGGKMKQVYGEFCSHHNEAVGFFKELQQHNKRFQSFIKQQGTNSLVRRREIPQCILLVTQRLTKYPVLLERLLQYTQGSTEEHADISKALVHIREVIAAVDLKVNEHEQHQKLQEVWNRMENRSAAKLKNGHTFRKQDMMRTGQRLKHQGLLLWKTATGRLKDVLALLLTDALIFLQEKDQKYTFAAVDQKPPVISLQKLIVREVANEERGMFLISASAAGPEMYEVHTSSKEERNTWMRLIREAVESCPEEEEEYTSESEEEKRAAEARSIKIHKFQESLMNVDQQICSCLEEKLHIYSELSVLSGRTEAPPTQPRLMVQVLSEEPPQAATLLSKALQEAVNLKSVLSSKISSSLDADPPPPISELTSDSSETSPENPEAHEENWCEGVVLQPSAHLSDIDLKVGQSVQNLTQLLYSLQAAVTIQDTCYEVQKLLLQDGDSSSPKAQRTHHPSTRCPTLQEQEKQRNLEKQKEEALAARRLQERLRQEKEAWERQCQAKQNQQGEQEERCQVAAERLRRERKELDERLEEYQQSLERLRDGQKNMEKELQSLENQRKRLGHWRHERQSSLPLMTPNMVIPLDGTQASTPSPTRGRAGTDSVFVNEAALTNNRHHTCNKRNDHNSLNTLLARSNSRQSPVAKAPQGQDPHCQGWLPDRGVFYSPVGRIQHTVSDRSSNGEAWSSKGGGAKPHPLLPYPSDPQLVLSSLVSMGNDSGGEEGKEETIVYL
ncbi:rho guanine nucleotide exchange factor 28 [Gouania willdenowi]|uniref:Rho guanine nucleotide exchange factor 28-like n=1 Tax=Gouania willdenowi TaxID=441366 RepID=A0A8C5GGB5_GOUWI|nr:rho guanine nucleotide exchange factor 28-like [Gouania willdenowi]